MEISTLGDARTLDLGISHTFRYAVINRYLS